MKVYTWNILVFKAFPFKTSKGELKIMHANKNNNWHVFLKAFCRSFTQNWLLQVVLTLWRSRSSWGNSSGDNPHQIVSKTDFYMSSQSSSFENNNNNNKALSRSYSLFFCLWNIERKERESSRKKTDGLTFLWVFSRGSWLSRFNKLWGISLLSYIEKHINKIKARALGSLSRLMSLVFAVWVVVFVFFF